MEQQYFDNFARYNKLKDNKSYMGVDFDIASGGMKATHNKHEFSNRSGSEYEKYAQKIGFKNGNAVILGPEKGSLVKVADGTWNGRRMDIKGVETGKPNNIINSIKHCANKPKTNIAVLVFPNNNYCDNDFKSALMRYIGIQNKSEGKYKIKHVVVIARKDKNDTNPIIKKADL
jgi:hypothetical protein